MNGVPAAVLHEAARRYGTRLDALARFAGGRVGAYGELYRFGAGGCGRTLL